MLLAALTLSLCACGGAGNGAGAAETPAEDTAAQGAGYSASGGTELTLSGEGMAYLEDFTAKYSSVILSEANRGAVAQILVEGHTDTAGTHEYNQDLSERRTQSVVDCCLALEPELEQFITAKGCSFDDPVYDENGEVDMDASRRVVFRFILNAG